VLQLRYCPRSRLAHRHPTFVEVGFDGLKDLLVQFMLLQRVVEGQDRGFNRDAITDKLDAGKAAHWLSCQSEPLPWPER